MSNKSTEILEITPSASLFDLKIKEVIQYRYLLYLFIKRDFITIYKQTILGPLWHLIQPLLTTLIFTVVFGTFARIRNGGTPPILFYMSGLTLWSYFAGCINKTSGTFVANASIFGKVYFPRLTVPLASVISNLLSLGIQLCLLTVFLIAYRNSIHIQTSILLTPLFILLLAFIGFGFGIVVSSLTIKYRDLAYLMTFGVQLWMYATPIIYPLALIPDKYKIYSKLNPVTPIIEGFRYSLFGQGAIMWHDLIYSAAFTIVLVLVGILVFNRTERNFMDTV